MVLAHVCEISTLYAVMGHELFIHCYAKGMLSSAYNNPHDNLAIYIYRVPFGVHKPAIPVPFLGCSICEWFRHKDVLWDPDGVRGATG